MAIERVESTRPQKVLVVTAITCDVCGEPASQPVIGGMVSQGMFEQVRKPDERTNDGRLHRVADLCHRCADLVAEYINEMAANEYGRAGVRLVDEMGT